MVARQGLNLGPLPCEGRYLVKFVFVFSVLQSRKSGFVRNLPSLGRETPPQSGEGTFFVCSSTALTRPPKKSAPGRMGEFGAFRISRAR